MKDGDEWPGWETEHRREAWPNTGGRNPQPIQWAARLSWRGWIAAKKDAGWIEKANWKIGLGKS